MGRLSRLGKNTTLIMIGNVSSKILALLMLPFYTSWLSVEDYGITDLITVYATLLISFVSGCIAEAIFVIPKGQKEEDIKKYFTSGSLYLLLSLATSALIFYCVRLLFCYYDSRNSFTDNLWYIYFVMIANIVFLFLQQFCRSINKIRIYSFSGLLVTGITALLSFLLIPPYGVYGFVLANASAYIAASLFVLIFTNAHQYFQLSSYGYKYIVELLKYSIPLIPNAAMWWLVSASNRPLLEIHCGLFSIGILAVSYKFPGFVNVLLGAFNTSWLISVLEEYKKKDFQEFFNKGIQFFAFILIIASCLLTIFSENVVRLFTSNEKYFEAWIYIPILTLSTVFSCMAGIVGSIFSAARKSKYYFYSSVWAAMAALIGNITLIPLLGIWGAVITSLLSMAVMLCSRVYFARQFVELSHMSRYFASLLFFFITFAVTLFLNGTVFIVTISILLTLYLYINRNFIKFIVTKIPRFKRNI